MFNFIVCNWQTVTQGRMQDFSGGPNLKKNWGFGYTWCEQRSCELLLGGFGSMPPPKKIFKNSAISYVLRAIIHHFHDEKNPLKKL